MNWRSKTAIGLCSAILSLCACAAPTPTIPQTPALVLPGKNGLPEGAVLRIGGQTGDRGVLSPDEQLRATGGAAGMQVIDAATGDILWSVPTGGAASSLAFSPDGVYLAALVRGFVVIWEAKSGKLEQTLTQQNGIARYAWSPDSKQIVAAGVDNLLPDPPEIGQAVIWEVESGKAAHTLEGHERSPRAVIWAADRIVTAWALPDQGEIIVWDASSGERLHSLSIEGDPPYSLALAPDQKRLAAVYGWIESDHGSPSGKVRIWELESGAQTLELDAPGVAHVVWSPDSARLASADVWWGGPVTIWDSSTGEVSHTLPAGTEEVWIQRAAWTEDGRWLATTSGDLEIALWDTQTGERTEPSPAQLEALTDLLNLPLEVDPGPGAIYGLDWSPDGKRLVTASREGVALWDAANGALLCRFDAGDQVHFAAAFSPDGTMVAAASGRVDKGTLALWNPDSCALIKTLDEGANPIYTAAWHPEGDLLAVVSRGEVVLWNVQTGSADKRLPIENGPVLALAWSPDPAQLAIALHDRVAIWDVSSDDVIELPAERPNSLAWSADGKRLAAGTGLFQHEPGEVVVWDVETQEIHWLLEGHSGPVASVAQADRWIVSAGGISPITFADPPGHADGLILLWDARSGKLARVLYGHTAEVQVVVFSPDGKRLASGSQDGTVLIWDVP